MPSTEACYNSLQQLQRTYIDPRARGQTWSRWIPLYYSSPFNLSHAYASAERGSGRHLSLSIQNTWTEGPMSWLGEAHCNLKVLCGLYFPHRGEKNPWKPPVLSSTLFSASEERRWRSCEGPRDNTHSPCADCTCYTPASTLVLEGRCYISYAVLKLCGEHMPKPPCFHCPCTLGAIFRESVGFLALLHHHSLLLIWKKMTTDSNIPPALCNQRCWSWPVTCPTGIDEGPIQRKKNLEPERRSYP